MSLVGFKSTNHPQQTSRRGAADATPLAVLGAVWPIATTLPSPTCPEEHS